jgi:hypothetical protein
MLESIGLSPPASNIICFNVIGRIEGVATTGGDSLSQPLLQIHRLKSSNQRSSQRSLKTRKSGPFTRPNRDSIVIQSLFSRYPIVIPSLFQSLFNRYF